MQVDKSTILKVGHKYTVHSNYLYGLIFMLHSLYTNLAPFAVPYYMLIEVNYLYNLRFTMVQLVIHTLPGDSNH